MDLNRLSPPGIPRRSLARFKGWREGGGWDRKGNDGTGSEMKGLPEAEGIG